MLQYLATLRIIVSQSMLNITQFIYLPAGPRCSCCPFKAECLNSEKFERWIIFFLSPGRSSAAVGKRFFSALVCGANHESRLCRGLDWLSAVDAIQSVRAGRSSDFFCSGRFELSISFQLRLVD